MKKLLKIIISAAGTLYLTFTIFFCMVSGAPDTGSAAISYIVKAAIFAAVLSSLICFGIHYILYLQKKLEEMEKEA